jgi:hypothetical protein
LGHAAIESPVHADFAALRYVVVTKRISCESKY